MPLSWRSARISRSLTSRVCGASPVIYNQIKNKEHQSLRDESFCNLYWCVHTSTYYLYIYIFLIYICISELSHVPAKWLFPSSFEFVLSEVWQDCVSVFFFLYFQFLLHYFSCLFVFFLSKVKFHKKATKYKKRNSCFVCWKFLLIKGDGQLDRDTDKQISWLINTNYRREKDVKYFLCYTARMVKKWLQLFFSIFYRKQFKRQKQTEK